MTEAQAIIGSAGDTLEITARGRWTIEHAASLFAVLKPLEKRRVQAIRFDLSGLEALDTTGAMLIARTAHRTGCDGERFELVAASPTQQSLIDTVREPCANDPDKPKKPAALIRFLGNVGDAVVDIGQESRAVIGFIGLVMVRGLAMAVTPWRFRFTSMVRHMEEAGVNAVPIVALISFLVGVVFAYQGAFQLRQFGAEVFVVDLLTLSVLREVGVLLTAIMVAGRSGSAFTAEIGAMKVREEIDAMRTIGLDVIDVLVLPRFVALLVMLPLLTFVADFAGMFGGMLMSWIELGITPGAFMARFSQVADPWHFFTGMIKAPFFAYIIALIGCFEGLQVEGSAESVGRLTTRAVVEAVFLVIVTDGIFSVFFALVGV